MLKSKSITIIITIIEIINSALLIFDAFVTKRIIDTASAHNNPIKYVVFFVASVLIHIILQFVSHHIKNSFSVKLETNLKNQILTSLLDKDIMKLREYHTGELSTIYLTDGRVIVDSKVDVIPKFFSNLVRIIMSLVAILILDYKILIVLLVGIMAVCAFSVFYYKRLKSVQKECLEEDGKVNAFMQEMIENVKVVKALEAKDSAKKMLEGKLTKTAKIKKRRNFMTEIAQNGLSACMNIFYLGAILYFSYFVYKDIMTYGELFAYIQLVMIFVGPLSMVVPLVTSLNSYHRSFDRINELFGLEPEVVGSVLPDFDRIVFENVSFSYDREVIKNFNLVVKKNDLVLFKGPSGCGKTTLFYLLLGFLKPTKGKIYIEYQGQRIEASASSRNLFSYVGQANLLFSGTLFENIRFFNNNVSDDEIIEALKMVNLYDELVLRDKDLNIELYEHGDGLSVGQIQRVLIAISLLQKKPIMLLDEFSSALDEKNERDIINMLESFNKTIIFISHRTIDIPRLERVDICGNR